MTGKPDDHCPFCGAGVPYPVFERSREMEKIGFEAVMDGADEYVEKVKRMAEVTDALEGALRRLVDTSQRLGAILNITINVTAGQK